MEKSGRNGRGVSWRRRGGVGLIEGCRRGEKDEGEGGGRRELGGGGIQHLLTQNSWLAAGQRRDRGI